MRCPKCNAELAEDQKVCVRCGALTPASGYYYQERKELLSGRSKQIILLSVGVVVFAFVLFKLLYVVPPQKIAEKWLRAMVNRQLTQANRLVTNEYLSILADRFSDVREVSDNLCMDLSDKGVSLVVGVPDIREMSPNDKAILTVSLVNQGHTVKRMQMELMKLGNKWKVNDFY